MFTARRGVTKGAIMQKILRLTPILALLALAACETMQGAGRDMQNAGQSLTQESQEVQSQL